MSIIAISRGTSSGGHALAELVAGQLGYPCVSREAIVDSTEWYGVPMEMPAPQEERLTSFWHRLADEKAAYIDSFRAALCERARRGNLVYHGHVGHLMLPGVPVLRVRVVADMDYRIQAVMHERELSHDESVAYIERVDKERKEWVHYLYGVDWEDSTLYDVVLNLSHLSLESACSTVAFMARLEEFQPTASSLRIMEDSALRGRVSAALVRDSRTSGARLNVFVKDGTVTISGSTRKDVLDSLPEAIAAVHGIKGVRYEVEMNAA